MVSCGRATAVFVVCACIGALAETPSRDEVRKHTMKELRAMLRDRGAACRHCVEKDHLVDRVLETWDWAPLRASSPDGKINIDKESFVKHLRSSLVERQSKEAVETTGGHQLAEQPLDGFDGEQFEAAWQDFSRKLTAGEVGTDDGGRIVYNVDLSDSPFTWSSLWQRYRLHIMMGGNLLLLFFMRRMRNGNKDKLANAKIQEAAMEMKTGTDPVVCPGEGSDSEDEPAKPPDANGVRKRVTKD